ncbi:MAG: heterodisulfide reductase-related iron-sulfur binding cluster, partial [Candidatus Neoclostridium sp.]
MKICYYPGCTLRTQAKELDEYARKSAAALDVQMEEIEEWQCCGAVYPTARDEVATKLSAVRALDYAKNHGGRLLTLCSACHNVMKRVNHDMQTDDNVRTKA